MNPATEVVLFCNIFVRLQLLELFFGHHHVVSQYTPEEIKVIVKNIANRRLGNDEQEHQRVYKPRRIFPEGDIFNGSSSSSIRKLSCGEAYPLAADGYIYFRLTSDKKCKYQFIGSRVEKCTAAILCEHGVNLEPPSEPGGICDREYFTIKDGIGGVKIGCDVFEFNSAPRIPRHGGTDLYLTYKGISNGTCAAFCAEDLVLGFRPKVKAPIQLAQKQNFKYNETDKCICGKPDDMSQRKILNETNAHKFEFPWIGAVVQRNFERDSRIPICGGQLINNHYFLSAAHCFKDGGLKPEHIQVLLHFHLADKDTDLEDTPEATKSVPGWDLPDSNDWEERTIRLDVAEIINHPFYRHREYDYDIAILKFKNPLDFNKRKVLNRASPICLSRVQEHFEFRTGDEMLVSGWGIVSESLPKARIPLKISVSYQEWDYCKTISTPSKRHICAANQQNHTCGGNSGGPLIYNFNPTQNQFLLAGIVSAGIGCDSKDNVGWYTNIQEVTQWIYDHTIHDSVWCRR